MEKIVYTKNIDVIELNKRNIVIDKQAEIEEGVIIGAGVCILGRSKIAQNCEIGNNSVIDNSNLASGVKVLSSFIEYSSVGERTTVGPFATIKKETTVGDDCRIGNFVEIKKSKIGNGVKIAHLTYVGDAEIGDGCNVGCGVVFCNYNGAIKQKSIVGKGVFIGSNVNIIAPVLIEDEAYIAAGSTINKDIKRGQLSIARSHQINKNNFKNPYKK